MRILALDYGEARIGVGISDSLGILAQPLETIATKPVDAAAMSRIAEIVATRDVGQIVIGLPLHMSGRAGPEAERTRAFGEKVKKRTGVPVEYLDERWSSREAERMLDDLSLTFLGAHAIPLEYQGNPQGYTDHLCARMLPAIREWWDTHAPGRPLPFVDVFCETGAFNLEQSRRILETARSLGFPLKIHADEFDNLGGARMAADLGAISADHLVKTDPAEFASLAQSDTVAVALPCTPFGLAETHYTPAQSILEAGVLLALASDLNPGTAWCGNMQFVIALACRYLRLTPAQAIVGATINAAAAIACRSCATTCGRTSSPTH